MKIRDNATHGRNLPLIAVLLGLLLLSLLTLARPATADWLVTIGGERIETDGPWQVNGNLVVFNLANGTLASLSAREVDLAASTVETRAAAARANQTKVASKSVRQAVLVLTDADVGHVNPDGAGGMESSDAVESSDARQETDGQALVEEAVQKPGGQVVVTSWDRIISPDETGVMIVGSVVNQGKEIANGLTIEVEIYDESGDLIAARPGFATTSVLSPGDSANFRAPFPTIFSFREARFQIDSQGVRLVAQPGGEGDLDSQTVSF